MDKPNNIIEMLTNQKREEARLAMIKESMRNALIAIVIQNIAVIAAFTVLAIMCGRWWIILPSILFMRDYTKPRITEIKRGEEKEK